MIRNAIYAATGFGLFCIGYLLINEQILVQSILYRAAASDDKSALIALASMACQATLLLIGLILLSNRLFWLVLILTGLSAATNTIFSQILNDIIDLAKFDWLLTEARHAQNAAGQFAIPAAIGLAKTLAALGLFAACRRLIRRSLQSRARLTGAPGGNIPAILILVIPSVAFGLGLPGQLAAERNIYNFAVEKLTIPPPPHRRVVEIPVSKTGQSVEKIIWIVDESIAHDAFAKLVSPDLSRFGPIDFGKASAMANCSAPAHVALRSGIDVMRVNALTDLRSTPSIWGYARKAGYKTVLIDGQVSGPPQNLLLPPEASKIDEIKSLASGMQTDLAIAKNLNARLKTGGKEFVYAVLRGVHFQYSDHYPAGTLPVDKDLSQQYGAAITYSKQGFFETLLDGVDRGKIAILYTSDHGQNVKKGVLPHCSVIPEKEEFAVPLLAFLPVAVAADFPAQNKSGHSASQIFPSTLAWMGYHKATVTKTYDNTLEQPTKKFVWFGRAVIPLRAGDRIEVKESRVSLVD
ncbi:sulfatase-like hydrolase/transferase [Parasphingorhabdus sp.]|uniref:sulfatase-like hydrolase/transferase n=1 Tax=Parasphingorhabdus sp. TaxID=2709688 RepID=UPI003C70D5D9